MFWNKTKKAAKVIQLDSPEEDGRYWIVNLVKKAGFTRSMAEAKRTISFRGVTIGGERIKDVNARVAITEDTALTIGPNEFILKP